MRAALDSVRPPKRMNAALAVFHPRRCLVVIFLTILKEIILVKNTTILETATAGEAVVVVLSLSEIFFIVSVI